MTRKRKKVKKREDEGEGTSVIYLRKMAANSLSIVVVDMGTEGEARRGTERKSKHGTASKGVYSTVLG